ncbi:MAG: hypothetical protein DHS20C05_24600 [Hyphococcus sp.]|nr:MAG: hypothetical protein DHS20C05_24600 [Marinicaulis sp.]
MLSDARKIVSVPVILGTLLLASESAWALRCGNRLIQEGMHEARVIELCGDPVSTRQVGYVLRPYIIRQPVGISVSQGSRHVYGGYHQELNVTEMLFNFGPHKLMRLIRFEGGRLTDIRTAGYGHRKPKKQ